MVAAVVRVVVVQCNIVRGRVCMVAVGIGTHAFCHFAKAFFSFTAGEFSPVWLALSGNWVVVQLRSGRKADRMTNLHMDGRE